MITEVQFGRGERVDRGRSVWVKYTSVAFDGLGRPLRPGELGVGLIHAIRTLPVRVFYTMTT